WQLRHAALFLRLVFFIGGHRSALRGVILWAKLDACRWVAVYLRQNPASSDKTLPSGFCLLRGFVRIVFVVFALNDPARDRFMLVLFVDDHALGLRNLKI